MPSIVDKSNSLTVESLTDLRDDMVKRMRRFAEESGQDADEAEAKYLNWFEGQWGATLRKLEQNRKNGIANMSNKPANKPRNNNTASSATGGKTRRKSRRKSRRKTHRKSRR